MQLWQVEHFFFTKRYLYSIVRIAFFRKDFLQNPYFKDQWNFFAASYTEIALK